MLWSLTRNNAYIRNSNRFLRDRISAAEVVPVDQIILEKKSQQHCAHLRLCQKIRWQYRESLENKIDIYERQRKPYRAKIHGMNRELIGMFITSGAYKKCPKVGANEFFICKYLPPTHLLYKAARSHPAAIVVMASNSLPNHATAVTRHKIRRMFFNALWNAYREAKKSDSSQVTSPNFRDGIYLFHVYTQPTSISWLYSEMQQIMEMISIPHAYQGDWIKINNRILASSLQRRLKGHNQDDTSLLNDVPPAFIQQVQKLYISNVS